MLRRVLVVVLLLMSWTGLAVARTVIHATGRTVQLPEHIRRVLPAGPPAAVLLEAVAPDLMLGWPSPVSKQARDLLPASAARLPQIPRLTGRDNVINRIAALQPDRILDYGTISPRYIELARTTQQRTGIPTLLFDGSLADKSLRAVRDGHALVAPALPFGWIEEPPSINRLLGLAWLAGRDPMTLAATFNAVVYGRVLRSAQRDAVRAGAHPVSP